MNTPYVQNLLVGKVKQVADPNAINPLEKAWESGMFKESTEMPVWLSKSGLYGDEVADKKNHGGQEKAIFAYPVSHYDYWQDEQHIEGIHIGGMGENLAVADMDEYTVCIGDTYQFGEAVIQVSQPRKPCWKPARRHQTMDLAMRIQKTGRTGWYFRVLQEGFVKAGAELALLERPHIEWSIANCNEVMYEKKNDLELAKKLVKCHLLADSWKQPLVKRLEGKASS
ncbi:MOSC domain-containing protein [Ornithinibacillus massiliensis]